MRIGQCELMAPLTAVDADPNLSIDMSYMGGSLRTKSVEYAGRHGEDFLPHARGSSRTRDIGSGAG